MQVEKVAYGFIMLPVYLQKRELLRTVEMDSGGQFVI
jgi:hypothetical protein